MPSSEPVNPSQSSSVGEGGGDERHNKQKQLDRDIREMVTSITNRITDHDDDDDGGVRIITLAGTNDGATLKSRVDGEKAAEKKGNDDEEEEEVLSTYVNSNFQAFNNSIMFSGSYQAHDPGVNVEISDFTDEPGKKKEKEKEKEVSKSDG